MADFTHETSYDAALWELPLSNKNPLNAFQNSQSVDDKDKNIADIYSEFLKNEIDFSESPEYFKPKRKDDFFDYQQLPSYDLEYFGTKSNRRHNDVIRSELEIDMGIAADNRPFLPNNSMANFGSLEYSSFSRLPEKRYMTAGFDEKVTDQRNFQEVHVQKTLPPLQMQPFGLPSQPEKVVHHFNS